MSAIDRVFYFPDKETLEICLKKHPAIASKPYYAEHKIIEAVAGRFAKAQRVASGIDQTLALTLADKGLGKDPIFTLTMIDFKQAVKSCVCEQKSQ